MGLLMLAGALGLLVFGMKLMSGSMQQVAGPRLRSGLNAMTAGRSRGVFTGISITLVMQYSSVVSVMVVSFVNSGLLSLRRAIPVLIGANIGTTLKLLLFTAVGFSSLDLSRVALALSALSLPLLLARTPRLKAASEALMGTALLFLAIGLLREHVPPPSAEAVAFLGQFQDLGLLSPLIFVGLGALLAFAVQSSSVALVLTLALCGTGIISYSSGAALVLGENIGTTFTANIAALAGNVWAKRAARAHLLIKLVGVGGALLLFRPLLTGVSVLTGLLHGADPRTDADALQWALTYWHLGFNVINGAVLLQFVPWIEMTVARWVPVGNTLDEQYRLAYLQDPMMPLTPEASLLEAHKEVVKLAKLYQRMLGMLRELLLKTDPAMRAVTMQRVARYAAIFGRAERELGGFLAHIGTEVREEATARRIRSFHSISRDLERVAAIAQRMSKAMERRSDQRLWFDPAQREAVLQLLDLLDRAARILVQNLEAEESQASLDEAAMVDRTIRRHCTRARQERWQDPDAPETSARTNLVLAELMSDGEVAGDHLLRVTEALVGRR
ncbi:MAG: Na/Pi cotransporter family protein [Flavobacteriales bacterium]|nr:Na/Pi cotransporter family protein [Flavobacteriales bacterium]